MTPWRHPLLDLLAPLLTAREEEREQAGRLLHDDIGQTLSAAGLQLDLLRMDIEEVLPDAARRLRETQQSLELAMESVRALNQRLNPASAGRAGLGLALERLVASCRQHSASEFTLDYRATAPVTGPLANGLFGVARQALDNAVNHAAGAPVRVSVSGSGSTAVLEVHDRGPGFSLDEAARRTTGLGLLLMSWHADRADLELLVETAPGAGTIVVARPATPAGFSAAKNRNAV